ncbi:ester cyclase [Saccharopolyspora sp. NPDC049357]|uniref:ester cyclase n=1 Tax=Saccharopolyspora sp. NPDC049357 TaxID=3154507 RepID=UPI00343D2BBA
MTEASEVQRRMFECVLQRDFDGLRELCHQEYEYISPDGERHAGAEAAVAVADKYTTAFSDMVFEAVAEYTCGESACVRVYEVSGIHENELEGIAPTWREIHVHLCSIVEIEDGKIRREYDFFDNASLLSQLGVVPTPRSSEQRAQSAWT